MYSFFSGHWGGCDTDLQSRLSTNQNKQWTYCMQILRMHDVYASLVFASSLPPLGRSDHKLVQLVPSYMYFCV